MTSLFLKRSLLLVVGIVFATATNLSAEVQLDVAAQPVGDAYFDKRRVEIKAALTATPSPDLVLLGDSITEGLNPQTYFPRYRAANLGIVGDRCQSMLWRIEQGDLDGIAPKAVVLLVGTNNYDHPAPNLVKGITAVVSQIHKRLPKTTIILIGVFPRTFEPGGKIDSPNAISFRTVNTELAKLDDGKKLRFLDVGKSFINATGNLPIVLFPDGVHPSAKALQMWADALTPLFEKLMK